MKHYPKEFEDRYARPSEVVISKIGSKDGSVDELILKTRRFYREVNAAFFDYIVKSLWLKSRFTYDGSSLNILNRNGYINDLAFAFFMKGMVGYNQKILLDNGVLSKISSYFADFFPEFNELDPFVDTEYFAFPYKNLSLDHIILVSECDDRLEMLDYAEKNSMNIRDFTNWVINWAYCYNEEAGKEVYRYVDTYMDRRAPVLRKLIK